MTNDKIIQRLERGSVQVQRTCSKFNRLFFYERGVPDVDLVLPLAELAVEDGIEMAEADEWPRCTRGGNTEGDLAGTLMTDAKNELIFTHGERAVFHTQKEMPEARNILFITKGFEAAYQKIIARKLGLGDGAPVAVPVQSPVQPASVNTAPKMREKKVLVSEIRAVVKPWKPKQNERKPGYIKVITHILQLIEADPNMSKGEKGALFNILERSLWYPEHDVQPTKYAVRIRSVAAEAAKNKKDVVFEHVYPKLWIREQLLKIKNPDFQKVQDFLDKHLVVALITKEEDDRLNLPEFRKYIGFERYQAAGIEIASVVHPGGSLT